ncbi:arsenate reductase ArsC [Pseudodesulfovibrio cashew]|uniref:Arsenate reductase ArsC n=1 Tax=Pseudodesulfovibrio cashew TaxID=2678688 RepID=A0A6I6JLA0_9BACT|nr:arsenate reductase ArsC [Pseudodesulfovibrio cashew]QGY41758.1 arsenate reductase ArsC [Pseudodesulfovibrio cashew]
MKILYLCTGNSCRSQMAEAWTRHLRPEIGVWSAGVVRHGMNPMAVRVMEEAGVDMSGQESKTVDDLPDEAFDYVVTLCGHAAENCPYFPSSAKRVHRGFDDPPSLVREQDLSEDDGLAVYRRVRDEIRVMVEGLPASLEA